MSQNTAIHYIYAMQHIRSHLSELVEENVQKEVDQSLAELLHQFGTGQDNKLAFRQLLKLYPKARAWWTDFNKKISSDDSIRGMSGSSAADASLYGDAVLEPLHIFCAKCGFSNSLLSWNDHILCQNPDGVRHYIEI